MHKQIESALEKMATLSNRNQEMMLAILKRYAANEISLDEAYYDLLDEELIPMPQRCALSSKIPFTAEDENRLKERIRMAI